VTVFVVTLVVRDLHGASIVSTEDEVEATDAAEAERVTIERGRDFARPAGSSRS
jgi:hypothetical protein